MARGETYKEFTEKFKPKKTTDDCYTPPNIYDEVKNFAMEHYGIPTNTRIVRPFYPGGDYESFDYSGDAVVIDNPPFSILSQICRWYNARGIRYFLFAPTLTLFSTCTGEANYLPVGVDVIYDNGAKVNTSFVTNMGSYKIETSPELYTRLSEANKANRKPSKPSRYQYPREVITAAMLKSATKRRGRIRIREQDACFVRRLDAQKEYRKSIFGGGFLLSGRAIADIEAAEREAAAETAAEATKVWELSERERAIVAELGRH